jgi:peptide/nickel transport system permease protein
VAEIDVTARNGFVPTSGRAGGTGPEWMLAALRYLRRNKSLLVGLGLLFGLIAFAVIGGWLVNPDNARPLSTRVLQPPSWHLPFGSDRQGRNLFAVITSGTLLTLRIGLIAGFIGVAIGTALAFISAYYGGWVDSLVRGIVDIGLTVPNLMVLIVVALTLRQGMTVNVMALVIASLAWLYPARTIRSQVLTLRERAYVQIARLSGTTGPGIIVKELLPNLLPYITASLVGSVSAAILASIGLDVLGLGVFEAPTLGMTLYWVNFTGAVINGWWWWWLAPIIVVGVLFIALFLISVGLDEIANPRLRRQV